MKKLFLLLIALLFGCSGLQIQDSSTHKLLADAVGKTMAISINTVRPDADPELTNEWVALMEQNAGNEAVSSDQMVLFFNQCVMIVVGSDFDKYGLMGDLSMLLSIYGAEMDDTGRMTMIQPVPLAILKAFELGYANGRAVARR